MRHVLTLALITLPLAAQPAYRMDTFAGVDPLTDGGPAVEAYLAGPDDMAVLPDGGFVIADQGNKVIRRVSPEGVIRTIAGFRTRRGDSGIALEAGVFSNCVAASRAGRIVYCTGARVEEILPDGRLSTVAGGAGRGYEGDGGPADKALLRFVSDVAFAPDGSMYIADVAGDTVRRVSPEGVISTVAGVDINPGFSGDGGPGPQAQLDNPGSLAVAPDGALLIVDERNLRIRRVGVDGVITTIAGTGENGFPAEEQPAIEAKIGFITSVGHLPSGEVLFGSSTRLWRIGADGLVRRFAGTGNPRFSGDGGPALDAEFFGQRGLSVDAAGGAYFCDSFHNRIRRVGADGVMETLAGRDRLAGGGMLAAEAVLLSPSALARGGDGSIYFVEQANQVVRRIGPDGLLSTVAGDGRRGSSGDGGPATAARLNNPTDVAYDPATDSLYIADTTNRRVRRVDSSGVITTFAGDGPFGFTGDGGPAMEATLRSPSAVAVGADGRVFIVDQVDHRVRVVDAAGVITTFAGNGERGFSGDGGPATAAQLSSPSLVLAAPDGSVYISDTANRAIRRVTPDGVMQTFLQLPFSASGMALEPNGALLLSNRANSTIERWVPGEPRVFVAGVRTGAGFLGDGGPSEDAAVRDPGGLLRLPDGRVLIADRDNHRIRVLTVDSTIRPPVFTANGIRQAASFFGGAMAPETIISLFGEKLALSTEAATSTPLPTELGGARAMVIDSAGVSRPAGLFFASPNQLNLYLPAGIASGQGLLRVETGGAAAEAPLGFLTAAPGLFSANASGRGVAAAAWLLVRSDGTRESGFVFRFDANAGAAVPVPVPLGEAGDQLFLTLFGTGIRGGAPRVNAVVDGQSVPVLFAGEQPDFVGLDQVNIGPIDRGLSGRSDVTVRVDAISRGSNAVTVSFQ